MKSLSISLMLTISLTISAIAQNVTRLDPYDIQYEPDVILVKFKENVDVPVKQKGTLGKWAPSGLLSLFQEYGIDHGERLFPKAKPKTGLRKIKAYDGTEHEVGSLYNIFKFQLKDGIDPKDVADKLNEHKDVEYAEPDYIFSALETVPNDPLYSSQQWYLPVINAPAAWDTTTGDTTQLIAIIDTGVDWDHADLDGKIKINWTEYNGASGVDDDGNGKIDDIRGWDFVNNDNNPNDDNSHGTHVAGIAAAETNNSTGISGVSWGAKILPVKVLQSTGYGSSSTVALGVTYAANLGATILNLSLGSYSESATLKTALENAYTTAVIVAAAGNDRKHIEPPPILPPPAPMFPACYGWVIGVEATKQTWDEKYGWRARFSNYDPSGPVSYNNDYGYNYELKAPGVSIHSTLPNGLYGNLSGTSMATPIVSGAVALLKTQQPSISTELLLGNLINGLGNTLDIVAAMKQNPQPDLRYISYTLVDTLLGCDNDGRPDTGETVEIWLTVKNVWRQADSVWSKLRLAPLEDPAVATITDSTSFIINGLSAYATATGESEPFKIQLASGLVNNRQIVFNYEIGCKNGGIQATGVVILTIQKGTEVGGLISTNTTWTNDNIYIVVDNIRIAENATLTIEPGTEIRLDNNKSIEIRGYIKSNGKPDSLITFINNTSNLWDDITIKSYGSADTCSFKYCYFEGFYNYLLISYPKSQVIISDCIFNNPYTASGCFSWSGPSWDTKNILIQKNNFMAPGKYIYSCVGFSLYESNSTNSKFYFLNNNLVNINSNQDANSFRANDNPYKLHFNNNNIFNNYNNSGVEMNALINGSRTYADIENNYWGLTDSVKIKNAFYDFYKNGSYPIAKFWPYLTQPSENAHGIVWKVLVNSKNPQEETVDPMGMETVRFDVYFNCAMDTAYDPVVTFGVRDPYTQHVVEDTTSWSADSTIWTGYYTVGLETGDGINTIRVSGAKDTDHFEIPIENRRFQFTIDAAGAAANQFLATAAVGKVDLEWPSAPTEDALGYNMYRIMKLTDSTYTDTSRINGELVTDTTYTDFAVIPDSTYRYAYKVLGTDMAESDYSKFITATPVSAASGDANGDLSVNVLDIVAIVNYILEENPEPFLSEAADVNDDGSINVLDIVGVVNIILGTPKRLAAEYTTDTASLSVSDNKIILNSPLPVYAAQFSLTGNDLANCVLRPTSVLDGFEIGKNETDERIKVIIYNLNGITITEGENVLFDIEGGSDLTLTDIHLADRTGGEIPTSVQYSDLIPERFELLHNYPNPFNPVTKIKYGIPKAVPVELTIFNVLGQQVRLFKERIKPAGYYEIQWDGRNKSGVPVSSGIYFYRFKAGDFVEVKKMMLLR
ncbi:S8 family serine peptidase [candidate division KSB1 bacterium]|nr:S8 family serine peptidase [candidate division KSB1 bacterium]